MVMWVFGYGSLIWKAGFKYDDRLVGFIKDYRRVFFQGSTDHRGTPEYPGRTVTLEPAPGEVCWGIAYKVSSKEDKEAALLIPIRCFLTRSHAWKRCMLVVGPLQNNAGRWVWTRGASGVRIRHLEVREKQYDKKAFLDFYTESPASTPALSGVMVYIASPDKKLNKNYLGPASLEELARQIIKAEGPSGPNRDYLFHLEKALVQLGCEDKHVTDLANEVRKLIQPETAS